MTALLFLSAALLIVMAFVEACMFQRTRRLTFLSAVHVLIALGYCLPPFLMTLLPDTQWQFGPHGPVLNPWGVRLYLLDLADHLQLPIGAFQTEMIVLIGAYAVLVSGYLVATRMLGVLPQVDLISRRLLAAGGAVLGAMAVIAIILYTRQFDDISHLLRAGFHIREGTLTARWGYFQVLGQIGAPAFFLLLAATWRYNGAMRVFLLLLAAIVWACVTLRMLHSGGRLELGAFLLAPLLGWVFIIKTPRVIFAPLVGLTALTLIVVSLPHTFFRQPLLVLPEVLRSVAEDLPHHLLYITSQFAFPFVSGAHTLTTVPDSVPFRYFIDVPLGLLYMLPNFSGVETLPPMILNLHVKMLPWIPVDLFSFGYYSLGTVGVLIIFASFGAVLALFDRWLSESVGWLGQTLRAAWLFYLPFRLFYADPYAAMQSGFGLIAGTVMVAALAAWTSWRRGKV